jgi:Tfp pilus assembly protein PilE
MGEKKKGMNPLLAIVVSILILTFLAYVAWVNFQIPKPVPEAKSNLAAIYVAQQLYFSRYNHFAASTPDKTCFQLIDWEPAGQNRYRYYCDTSVILEKISLRGCNPVPPHADVSKMGFTVYAIGNIDNDDQCDVWSINDAKIMVNVENDI